MKHIQFHRIFIEGFRSLSVKTELRLDTPGVTLVQGSNGLGKTAIFEALAWALYKINLKGTPAASVVTWEAMRPASWQGTRVVVDFSIGEDHYRLARHLKFKGKTGGLEGGSSVLLFHRTVPGKFLQDSLVGDGLHGGDLDSYIERLLGMDSKVFLGSVLFGQRMERFIGASAEDKRAILERLFDLDWVAEAKGRADGRIQETVLKQQEKMALIRHLETGISAISTRIADIERHRAGWQQEKDARVKRAEGAVKDRKASIARIEGELADLVKTLPVMPDVGALEAAQEQAHTALHVRKGLRQEAERRISGIKSEIAAARLAYDKAKAALDSVPDKCSLCKAPLDAAGVEATKAAHRADMERERKVAAVQEKALADAEKALAALGGLEEAEAALEEARTALKQARGLANLVQAKQNQKAATESLLEAEKKRLETDRQTVKAEKAAELMSFPDTEELARNVAEHQAELANAQIALSGLEAQLSHLRWWSSKAFSAGGLRSHVFSAMLGQLNSLVGRYAQRWGLGVDFGVDLTKATRPFVTTVRMNGLEVSYGDLSGGQKQRVDIALMFALHDLVSASTSLSIMVMDEVFEGLDEEGVETCFDLIRQKAEGRSVFVITHATLFDGMGCSTLTLEAGQDGPVIQ